MGKAHAACAESHLDAHRFGGVEVAACLHRMVREASDGPNRRSAKAIALQTRQSRTVGCRGAHSSVEAGQFRWSERASVKTASNEAARFGGKAIDDESGTLAENGGIEGEAQRQSESGTGISLLRAVRQTVSQGRA